MNCTDRQESVPKTDETSRGKNLIGKGVTKLIRHNINSNLLKWQYVTLFHQMKKVGLRTRKCDIFIWDLKCWHYKQFLLEKENDKEVRII